MALYNALVMNYPDDMRAALDKLQADAQKLTDGLAGEVIRRPDPEILYHYTDDAGLHGILESGTLWLSDIFGLNDPSELSHGVAPAITAIRERAEAGPGESQIFARKFESFYRTALQEVGTFLVTCFSAAADDLGQWRAYAANGCGYALGFDAKKLVNLFMKQRSEVSPTVACSTYPLDYDDSKLVKIQNQLVELAFPLISLPRGRELSADAINAYMRDLGSVLSVAVIIAALFFKHPAYAGEAEFRLLQIFPRGGPVPDLKFRHKPHDLISYRPFQWRQESDVLRRIVIGPAVDFERARRFVDNCLAAYHVDNPKAVEVVRSQIPYRAVGR
jgi:hypothetical protein